MDAPRHAVALFPAQQMGVEAGKQRGAVYMSPCVLCYSKSRNNIVQACPRAPPPPASWEGRDAHVRFYWVQFGNNSNAVADNRGGGGGAAWRSKNNPLESQLQWSQSRSLGINLLLVMDDVSACRRVLIAGLRGWWSGRSGLGSGPAAVRQSTGKQGVSEISWTGSS